MSVTISHAADGPRTPSASGGPVTLHGVSWEQYEAILAALGNDHPSLRLTYCEGTLDIMTTLPEHERLKTLIARLLELWALECDVPLEGYGAATFRKQAKERGLEPDECYVIGRLLEDMPDIAIEVVHRHGGIDKLDVYAGLGIKEVWYWQEGQLVPYALHDGAYRRIDASALLPTLDLAQLSAFVGRGGDQTTTLREYRHALRER